MYCLLKRNYILKSYIFIGIAAILMFSCKSTKFLNEDQSLVKQVDFEIIDSTFKSNKEKLTTELNFFVRQKKNKKLLLIPREYIYLNASQANDTSKLDSWLRKNIGEKPSIYDKAFSKESAKAMEQFLKYKKGYYFAQVKDTVITKNKISKVKYIVNTGARYHINSLEYYSKDENMLKEVNSIKNGSLLKVGDPIDGDKYELEKARIVNILQNRGYADFAGNYITINGDSTIGNFKIDLILEILNPIGKKSHTLYTVGEIKVYTDHYHKQDTSYLYSEEVNGIKYFTEQPTFIVKPKVIGESISFEENQITKRDDKIKTYNKLSTLGVYRFSEIVPKKNKLDSTIIDYDIQLTPHSKKWTSDKGLDAFSSTITRSADSKKKLNLLGLGLNAQYENRNLFRGSEKLVLDAEVSTQIELSNIDSLFRVFNFSLGGEIQYPTFKDPLKIIRSMKYFYLTSDKMYQAFQKNATTSLSAGANSVNFRDLYSINSINASLGYRYTDSKHMSILLDQVGISYNQYFLSKTFLDNNKNNIYLLNSFIDNLMTGVFFRNISYNYLSSKSDKGFVKSFYTNLEVSGFEVSTINGIANLITGKNDEWQISNISFSKFVRVEFDGRLTKFFKGKRSMVGRLNFGVISPWIKNQATPYIKQFNVGGPNSLRAWAPRSLGPGAINDTISNTLPYSQGDLKLEVNAEYRFNIWWILQGAFFVDAGNIWALKGYDDADDAKFSSTFYKQIAIAAGYGLRWDFDYFNIRFDFGYRVRNPFPTNGKYWYSPKEIRKQNQGNIQVAVNYPF
jgi:outer membrane protein insertion porin family